MALVVVAPEIWATRPSKWSSSTTAIWRRSYIRDEIGRAGADVRARREVECAAAAMRPITATRSLDKIVDDIIEELEPLRHDVEKTREAVRTAIANTRVMAPRIYNKCAASIKAKARAALRALDALMRAYPYLNDSAEFQHVRTWADLLTRTTRTPHHNRDIFQGVLTRLAKNSSSSIRRTRQARRQPGPTYIMATRTRSPILFTKRLLVREPTSLEMARALHRAFATHE